MLLRWFRQASTQKGLTLIVGSLFTLIDPTHLETIVVAVGGVIGVIDAIRDE